MRSLGGESEEDGEEEKYCGTAIQ